MTIKAEVVADSISNQDIRLTTFRLYYPRVIHAELMTHRVFSRNASSSRAIPVKRLIEQVEEDPFIPVFGKNQKGMQSREPLDDQQQHQALWEWLDALDSAVNHARRLADLEVHKQHVNRLLEPFSHINVLVTATDFDNWFWLRRHPDAQPEIRELADKMYEARKASHPVERSAGSWHLPFADDVETASQVRHFNQGRLNELDIKLRVSVARCARVSYQTFDGKTSTVEADLDLYNRLLSSEPLHASPAEHQATPDTLEAISDHDINYQYEDEWGNFYGWRQFRKMLHGERCIDYEEGITN